MEDLCAKYHGVGLAAAQVGVPWKLFIVKVGSNFEYYVNCDYTSEGDKFTSIEGCLSIRNEHGALRYFQVDRSRQVRVKGHRLTTKPDLSLVTVDFLVTESFLSTVFQHEIDHQFGILISDIGKEIDIEIIYNLRDG